MASMMVSQVAANSFSSPGEGKVRVSFDSYGYVVNLPLEVKLHKERSGRGGYSGMYEISAKGLIEDQNTLNIIPDAEVRMRDKVGNEAIAKITQVQTGWRNDPGNTELSLIEKDSANGSIRVEKLPAPEEYRGTLYFDISISED